MLSYEVWKKIVSYLPVGGAKELYTVNSALFHIAMDLRYQEARLWTGSPKAHVCKDLRVFLYPHLSHRPKTLHIDLGSIAKSLSGVKVESPLRRFITNLVKRSKLGTVSEIVAVALDALPQLTAVTKLSVIHGYTGAYHDAPLILQLLGDVWKVFGGRLRSLQVQVVFENLELLLPISLNLPNLEILTVNADGVSSTTASACESIIPTMIRSHASSLRDVSFTTSNAAVDTRPIFQSLQVLPGLRAIHISIPFGPFVPSPFPAKHMLYSLRHHLEFLSLDFETFMHGHALRSSTLFSEDWCSVDLSRLRELRINPPIMCSNQEFIDYIHRFAPSLTSLWIKPNLKLPYRQLSSIFRDFLSLRNLSISIEWFFPDVLALLAQTLPHLQTLKLQYFRMAATTQEPFYNSRPLLLLFYQAMQQHTRIFREWQLVLLDYESIRSEPACIERALVDHLPNVEWFCGVERSTYLSRALVELLPSDYFATTTLIEEY